MEILYEMAELLESTVFSQKEITIKKINMSTKNIMNLISLPNCTVTILFGMYLVLKQHKPWFDEECLGILDQRKQVKTQWIQDPSQSNVNTLNKVRRDASRHFRN